MRNRLFSEVAGFADLKRNLWGLSGTLVTELDRAHYAGWGRQVHYRLPVFQVLQKEDSNERKKQLGEVL